MRRIIPIACAAVLAIAQSVNITMSVGGKSVTLHKLPKSTITFDAESATSDSTGTATFNVGEVTSRRPAAAMQFDLIYNVADVSSVSVAPGPAAIAAGKNVQCASPTPGTTRCIVVGMNQNIMGPGPVAQVTVKVVQSTNFQLSNLVASSAEGTALSTMAGMPSTVTFALAVSSLSCNTPAYDQGLPAGEYNIEPGETLSCTATLNSPAPSSGATFPVTASDTGVTTPATVTIPAGQTTAIFTIAGS